MKERLRYPDAPDTAPAPGVRPGARDGGTRSADDTFAPGGPPSAAAEYETSPAPGPFVSILDLVPREPADPGAHGPPACFHDLHLDQIVESVTAGWEEYELHTFFYAALSDPDAIRYRQEVMRDLEREPIRLSVESFSQDMRAMRANLRLASSLDYPRERERWFLAAVLAYCGAAAQLSEDLGRLPLRSRGLRAFRDHLATYVRGPAFQGLAAAAREVLAVLSLVQYCLRIRDDQITVLPFQDDPDYTTAVEATFERFRRGEVKDYRIVLPDRGRLNHVEAKILDRVARLHPAVFSALGSFTTRHATFLDETIQRFDREIQFYLAYLRFLEKLRVSGLRFCYPEVTDTSKALNVRDGFDLSLAISLASRHASVVTNDFALRGAERVFVVTGPNQGGKTTFARMFGQLHYLACLGCQVPATEARLPVFDRLFSHFERREDVGNLRGKLQDDLIRLRALLDRATPRSIIILNEVFASTTLKDALYLGRMLMGAIARLDCLAVCVTFLDELAVADGRTVSVVSAVAPDDPTVRTFKIERRPADGLAYAQAIAEKYHVTEAWLKERLGA